MDGSYLPNYAFDFFLPTSRRLLVVVVVMMMMYIQYAVCWLCVIRCLVKTCAPSSSFSVIIGIPIPIPVPIRPHLI